jgi:hypothetical protein
MHIPCVRVHCMHARVFHFWTLQMNKDGQFDFLVCPSYFKNNSFCLPISTVDVYQGSFIMVIIYGELWCLFFHLLFALILKSNETLLDGDLKILPPSEFAKAHCRSGCASSDISYMLMDWRTCCHFFVVNNVIVQLTVELKHVILHEMTSLELSKIP